MRHWHVTPRQTCFTAGLKLSPSSDWWVSSNHFTALFIYPIPEYTLSRSRATQLSLLMFRNLPINQQPLHPQELTSSSPDLLLRQTSFFLFSEYPGITLHPHFDPFYILQYFLKKKFTLDVLEAHLLTILWRITILIQFLLKLSSFFFSKLAVICLCKYL